MNFFLQNFKTLCFSAIIIMILINMCSSANPYYEAAFGKPANEITLKAIELFKNENLLNGQALDLGCGEGRDTLELLRKGWNVIAVDKNPQAFQWLQKHKNVQIYQDSLTCITSSFEDFFALKLSIKSFDLIVANWALPFSTRTQFPSAWNNIVSHLKIGGRFAGHFFGKNHSWTSIRPNLIFFTKDEVLNLFQSFEIEYFEEENTDKDSMAGEKCHWHVYTIIAKKLK